MSHDSIYKIYAQLLKWHNKGHALWEPVRSDRIRPGSVGYFDRKGRWETVLQNVQDVPSPMEPFTKDIKCVEENTDTSRDFISKSFEGIDLNLGIAYE